MDVFIRDFVGDTGTPHERPIGESPDVILRTIQSRDPRRDFGAGSETVVDVPVENVAAGGTKYVYLRVLNRENVPAADVPTVVYWAPLETVHDTISWRAVGGYAFGHVPPNHEITVSDAIVWPPQIGQPRPGLMALIAWVNHDPGDPLFPFDQTFTDRASFDRFVRQHNNIAVRIYRFIQFDPWPWWLSWVANLWNGVLGGFRRLMRLIRR